MSSSHSETPVGIRRARLEELAGIARLAEIIWNAHYPSILSREQIRYMLDLMYAVDKMQREVCEEGICYWVAEDGSELVGFAAAGPTETPHVHKLHKLYVHPQHHRQGWGRKLLAAVQAHVRNAGSSRLVLCVNKRNETALRAYEKYGFRPLDSVCTPIGGGFVMDDFVLGLDIDASSSVTKP